jgi:nitrite reductase/ring-hydroxylating ferredoxin subunit
VTWRAVATVADGARARPWLPVTVDGRRFALARVDGQWYGVADACTHAGCPFSEEAALEGATIVCDCHGSEFDLPTGEVRRGPAEYPVRTVPVRVAGDSIEVDV